MKGQRLQIISHIINSEVIRNQDDLIKSLAAKGIYATQATLSRDMKTLKIVKKRDENNLYVYSLPETATVAAVAKTDDANRLRLEFSGNLAVVKTRPGYAMGIASDIDKHNPREIAGTIAGDDTILIIPREGYSREQVALALSLYIK
jgi:transcriptional regulator of arginine metabolism